MFIPFLTQNENISFFDGLSVTAICVLIVFAMLILLALAVALFQFIKGGDNKVEEVAARIGSHQLHGLVVLLARFAVGDGLYAAVPLQRVHSEETLAIADINGIGAVRSLLVLSFTEIVRTVKRRSDGERTARE